MPLLLIAQILANDTGRHSDNYIHFTLYYLVEESILRPQ